MPSTFISCWAATARSGFESAAFILAAVLLPLVLWHSSADGREPALTSTDNRWLIALSIVSWAATLAPFLTLPFLSDDYVFLAAYQRFSDALRAGQFFRPMFAIAFTLLARVGGDRRFLFTLSPCWCTPRRHGVSTC